MRLAHIVLLLAAVVAVGWYVLVHEHLFFGWLWLPFALIVRHRTRV